MGGSGIVEGEIMLGLFDQFGGRFEAVLVFARVLTRSGGEIYETRA